MTTAIAHPPAEDVRAPLAGASFDHLATMFDDLPHPSQPPHGVLRGQAVALAGAQRLPGWARQAVTSVLARLIAPCWRGKRIAHGSGSNLWLPIGSPLAFGHFAVRQDHDGPLLLDYDVSDNPAPLRRIVGELRTLAPGLYLGRMDLVTGNGRRPVLYFTLEH